MKLRMLFPFAGVASAMIVSPRVQAAYLGLGTNLYTTVTLNGTARDVWRVYAVFSKPDDYVTAIGGSPVNGAATIINISSSGFGPGTGFFNAGGGNTAPVTSYGVYVNGPNSQWDTYATIGATKNDANLSDDDLTAVSPSFPTFINGAQWGPYNNAAWFTPGPVEQGRAGGPGGVQGPFFAPGLFLEGTGILIMQLTVNHGQYVAGTVFVNGISDGSNFTASDQEFSSPLTPPAPGAVAVLGLAALKGRRRRA